MARVPGSIISAPSPRPVPGVSKLGVVILVFGLLYDLVEHGMGLAAAAGRFSTGEHTAHLIALIGMVLVLAGVVIQGLKTASQCAPCDKGIGFGWATDPEGNRLELWEPAPEALDRP